MGAMSGGNASATQGPVTQDPSFSGNTVTVGGAKTIALQSPQAAAPSSLALYLALAGVGVLLLVLLLRRR